MQSKQTSNQQRFLNNNISYQTQEHSITPPNNILTKKNGLSYFIGFVQLGLKTLFLILLFIPGMFQINNTTNTYSYDSYYDDFTNSYYDDYTIDDSISVDKSDSLFNFSFGEFDTLLDEHGDDLFCDLYTILFFIVVTFFVADFVLSIIRTIRPTFVQNGQWQFILPLMTMFTFFIEIITFYNFNHVEATEYYMVKGGETYLTSYRIPDGAFRLSDYTTHIDIGFLAYVSLAIGVIILVLDFYTIFFKQTKTNHKKEEMRL